MATLQHRRNKRNRTRSITGQYTAALRWVDLAKMPIPDLREMQDALNGLHQAFAMLVGTVKPTIGELND